MGARATWVSSQAARRGLTSRVKAVIWQRAATLTTLLSSGLGLDNPIEVRNAHADKVREGVLDDRTVRRTRIVDLCSLALQVNTLDRDLPPRFLFPLAVYEIDDRGV